MGIFSRKKAKAQFQRISPFNQLPDFLQKQGRDIGTGAFDVFQDLISGGESEAASQLFSRSRARTINDFNSAVQNAGLDLNRLGLASSGQKDKTFASLALSLGDILTQQDALRSEQQRNRQTQGATLGLNAINANAGSTLLNPIIRDQGFARNLLGGAANSFAGGFLRGLGGSGENFGTFSPSSLFGSGGLFGK